MVNANSISGVKLSNMSGIKVNSFNPQSNNTGTTIKKYNTQTYDDIIDFNNIEVYDQYSDINILKKYAKENWLNNLNLGDVLVKGGANAVFYTGTGIFDATFFKNLTSTSASSPKVILLVAIASSGFKVVSGQMTGKETFVSFVQGFSKPLLKAKLQEPIQNQVEHYLYTIEKFDQKFYKTIAEKSLSKEAIEKGFKPKLGRIIENEQGLLLGGNQIANQVFKQQMLNALGSMQLGCAVDYAASLGVNVISTILAGEELTPENLKLGSTLVKSAWKTVCATAFEVAFSAVGCGKVGKIVGNIVGATIGEFVVKAFDGDENWCLAAGVSTIAFSSLAGSVATSLIIGSSIAISVPVAGWIVGGAIIVGAAVGTFAVWFVKVLSG